MTNMCLFLTAVIVAARLPVSTGVESAPRQTNLPPRVELDSPAMTYRDARSAVLSQLAGLATDETLTADSMALQAGLAPAR